MFAFAHNEPVDPVDLAEFFLRSGWSGPEATRTAEWAMAAAQDWVTCAVDGELIGFGRASRLEGMRTLAFDVVVDERFRGLGIEEEIARQLAVLSGEDRVSVFRSGPLLTPEHPAMTGYAVPDAPPGSYLG